MKAIHHINGDPTDNTVSNLREVEMSSDRELGNTTPVASRATPDTLLIFLDRIKRLRELVQDEVTYLLDDKARGNLTECGESVLYSQKEFLKALERALEVVE